MFSSSSSSSSSLSQDSTQQSTKRLRQACDACHGAKTKCCGSTPCTRCQRLGSSCQYSQNNRAGRPKGTRNKKSHDGTKDSVGLSLHQIQHDGRSRAASELWPCSLSSYTSSMPSTPQLDLHGRQPSLSNMPFDFNPNCDFAAYATGFQDPATVYQQGFPFPLMSNPCGIDPIDNFSLAQDQANFSVMASAHSMMHTKPIIESHNSDSRASTQSNSCYGSPFMLERWPSDDAMDVTTPDMEGLDMDCAPLRNPSSKALLDEMRCQCLHRHAKLLTHLQELLEGLSELPVDVILNGVEQGLKSWDTYLQCRTCQHDQHREVLLLSAVSIRAVTRLLQGSSRRLFLQSTGGDRMNGGGNMHPQLGEAPLTPKDTRFTYGSYEIKSEDSLLVLGVLVSRILAKIEIVLASLKKSLPRYNQGELESPDDDAYTNYLHKLLEGLEASVHVLSANLVEWRL